MKIRLITILVTVLVTLNMSSQKLDSLKITETKSLHFVKDYPEGFYINMEEFLAKKVRRTFLNVERHSIEPNRLISDKEEIVDQLFFYDKLDSTKVRDVFAISFEGNLYIQAKNFRNYAKKANKSEEAGYPNSFCKVLKEGEKFYFEALMINPWNQALAYGAAGVVGMAIAGKPDDRLRGIIFDFEKKEFNNLKNCKTLNLCLIENNLDDKIIDCDKKESFNLEILRQKIETLFKP